MDGYRVGYLLSPVLVDARCGDRDLRRERLDVVSGSLRLVAEAGISLEEAKKICWLVSLMGSIAVMISWSVVTA